MQLKSGLGKDLVSVGMWLNWSGLGIMGLQSNLIPFQNTSLRAAEMQPCALGTRGGVLFLSSSTTLKSLVATTFWPVPCELSGNSEPQSWLCCDRVLLQPCTQDSSRSSHNIANICVLYRDLTEGTWVNSAALLVSQPLRIMPLLLVTWGSNRFYILSCTFSAGGADSSFYLGYPIVQLPSSWNSFFWEMGTWTSSWRRK